MKFDARKFSVLPPGTNIGIDGFPGLRFVVSATRKTWTYRYKSPVDGKLRQIKLGERPGMSYPQAIVAWEAARSARDGGNDIAVQKKARRQSVTEQPSSVYTVRRLTIDYLGSIEHSRSASSLRAITALFKRLPEDLANQEPRNVTRTMAYAFIEKMKATPSLAIKFKSELALAWSYGIDSGKCAEGTANHWRDIMRGKLRSTGHMRGGEKTTKKRVLTGPETAAVLSWLPTQPSPLGDVLTLTLCIGARSGEVVQMRGDQVTVEKGVLWWTLPKEKTKNRNVEGAKDYRVPLIGRAAAIVSKLKLEHKSGFLFPGSKRGHVTQGAIGEALSRRMPYHSQHVDSGLTVTHWAAHDLRRTARTMLAEFGCPHEIGESILGHVLGGVAAIYNRYSYDAEKVVWLTRLSDELDRLCAANG